MLVSLLAASCDFAAVFALVASSSAQSSRASTLRAVSRSRLARVHLLRAVPGQRARTASKPSLLAAARQARHAPRPQSSQHLHSTMDFRASNAYTGPVPGYVFYHEWENVATTRTRSNRKTNEMIDAIFEKADDADIEEIDGAAVWKLLLTPKKNQRRTPRALRKYSTHRRSSWNRSGSTSTTRSRVWGCSRGARVLRRVRAAGRCRFRYRLLAHENPDVAASAAALLFDLTDADDAVGDEALKGHQAFVKALVTAKA